MASNSLPPASSSPPASVTPNASIASSRAAASCAFFCRAFSSSSPSGTESSASFFFSAAFFAASSASRLSRASIFFSSSVLSLGLLCAAYAAAAAAAASRARGDGQRGARCGAAAGGSADGERRGAGAHPWPWPHPPLPASACRGPPRHSSLPSRRHCRRPAASGLPPPNRRRRLRGGERRSLERECREGGCVLGWAALPLGCSSPQLMSVRGGLRLLHGWFTTPLRRHLESADTTPIQTQRTWAVPALLTLLVGKPAVASTRGLSPVLRQAWLPGEPRSG